jgi:hypothetical protein
MVSQPQMPHRGARLLGPGKGLLKKQVTVAVQPGAGQDPKDFQHRNSLS